MTPSITLIPSGGLANRMRAIASAVNLCREVGSSLRVIWFRDWALGAPFGSIFEQPATSLFELREANWFDLATLDRPRRRNFFIPRLYQSLAFATRIDERQVSPLKERGFSFVDWARGKRCYMSCYQEFGTYPDELYAEIFHPCDAVRQIIQSRTRQFAPYTIGFHIRRTDLAQSIEQSPNRLFIEAGERELAEHSDLKIYLATDDESVKAELRQVFPGRIITAENAAKRDSVEGIRDGLADLYTLAATARIYGSAGSSFSPMASRLGGGVPLEILSL